MIKNIKFERVSPLQGRIEGPRYSISSYGVYGTMRQDWSNLIKVTYNGPVFVIVSRYDRLGPYLLLYFLLSAILALSVKFHHFTIKVPGKRESGQKWSIIIQYVLL